VVGITMAVLGGRYALVLSAGTRLPDYPDATAAKKGAKSRRPRKPAADGS